MKGTISEYLRMLLHGVERPFDAAKRLIKRRYNLFSPVTIEPYRGYGNRSSIRMLGRVLEKKHFTPADPDAPWWRNARATIRRFRTDEVPGGAVRAAFRNQSAEFVSDTEGYLHIRIDADEHPSHAQPGDPAGEQFSQSDALWHPVQLELLERFTDDDTTTVTGEVLIPPESAEFGVISDIDDTILQSSATDFWRLARLTLFKNAHTRTPFPHVSWFYQALHRNLQGDRTNPIFYVSSSAWNIYDLLDEFMRLNELPRGPILLRDLGIDSFKLLKSGHDHKLDKIEDILNCYPRLPFILIGDSGQHDPQLYREAVRRHPGRIAAIYIRDVSDRNRDGAQQLAAELRSEGVEMLLMDDAQQAASKQEAYGFINRDALNESKRLAVEA